MRVKNERSRLKILPELRQAVGSFGGLKKVRLSMNEGLE
jgi:hypothetical protein